MGLDPLTVAIGVGAASAASSAASASQQNRQIRRAMNQTRQAADIEREAAVRSSELEKQKRMNEAARIQGAISVSAGERGVGMGGSVAALQRQADYDLALNRAIEDTNLYYRTQSIASGYRAQASRLASQGAIPLMQSVLGGLSGFSTGLAIGGGLDSIRRGDGTTPARPSPTARAELSTTLNPENYV